MSEEKVQKVQEKLDLDDIRLSNRPRIPRPKFSAKTTARLKAMHGTDNSWLLQ